MLAPRATLVFLCLFSCTHAAFGVNGPWTLDSPQATSVNLNAVASNGKIDVAVGDAISVVASTDGIHWNPVHTGYEALDDNLVGIAWTGTSFVAVGAQGLMLVSTDGLHWTGSYPQATVTVVPPGFATIVTSTDTAYAPGSQGSSPVLVQGGVARLVTGQTPLGAGDFQSVAWLGNRLFGAGAFQSPPFVTTDAVTWTKATGYPGKSACALASNDSELLVYDTNDEMYSTTDGATWLDRGPAPTSTGCPFPSQTLEWTGKEFALLTGGQFFTSSDGASWQTHSSVGTWTMHALIWDGNRYVAVGNSGNIAYSPDGATWTEADSHAVSAIFQSLVWTGSAYVGSVLVNEPISSVVVGNGGTWQSVAMDVNKLEIANGKIYGFGSGLTSLEVSSDGITWSAVTGLNGGYVTVAGDGNNGLVMLGYSGLSTTPPSTDFSAVSTDGGATWAQQNVNISDKVIRLIFALNEYIGITSSGVITSTDGVTWNEQSLGADGAGPEDITYGNGLLVVVTEVGRVFTSLDGKTWNESTVTAANPLTVTPEFTQVVWDGKEFLALSLIPGINSGSSRTPYQSSVWESDDGKTWYPEVLPPGFAASAIAIGSNSALIGDSQGAIAVATPGAGDHPTASAVSASLQGGSSTSLQLSGSDPAGSPVLYQFLPGGIVADFKGVNVTAVTQTPEAASVTVTASPVVSISGTGTGQYIVSNDVIYSAPATIAVTVMSSGSSSSGSGGSSSGSSGGGGSDGLLALILLSILKVRRRCRSLSGSRKEL